MRQIHGSHEAGYSQVHIVDETGRPQAAIQNMLSLRGDYNTNKHLRGYKGVLRDRNKLQLFKFAASGQYSARIIKREIPTVASRG